MMPTNIAVEVVSARVGQITLRASARTWLMNSPGFSFAMTHSCQSSILAPPAIEGFHGFRLGLIAAPDRSGRGK